MGSTAITGELIWPTQNDVYGSGVGGSAGDGKKFLEAQLRKVMGTGAKRNNYMISGGNLPASDADLTITIPAGIAILEGHYCQWPNTDITLPASNTSYIFVKLVFSGTLITGMEIEDNTSGTPPASSLQLGTATTSGSAVTSTTDTRIFKNALEVWTAGGTYKVPAGQYRVRLRCYGAGGGGASSGEPFGQADVNAGGSPGATSLGSLVSANAGAGADGVVSPVNGLTGPDGAHGSTGTGDCVIVGKGAEGGRGGYFFSGSHTKGGRGGNGAYSESVLNVTPGDSHTVTIASGGAGGAGGGGSVAGEAGQAGKIVIEYL